MKLTARFYPFSSVTGPYHNGGAVEVHLPCPALAEWLPLRLESLRAGAWIHRQTPRQLRALLRRWPSIEGGDEDQAQLSLSSCEALVFGVALERPVVPESCLAALRPGTWLVELAAPRPRVLRGLLGLEPRPLARAQASQARVLSWLGRGCHGLEQWESVDPHGVIVTFARLR